MPNYYIGDFIRETRIRRGYTQEQLSFGVCTPASLSRIETGAQTPGKGILDALLERLGIEDRTFDVFVSKKDMEICEAIEEITRNIADCDYVALQEHTKKLEDMIETNNSLQQQYLMFAKGILYRMQGETKEAMQMFIRAIGVTLPGFDGVTPMAANLLTFHEITIVNNIASLYASEGKIEEAMRLAFWLKSYMEKSLIDGKEKTSKYPMILYNLSNWLGKLGRYQEALAVAGEGIDFCIRYGNLVALPLLIFNKGYALAEQGDTETAKKFFRQAAVIFDATKQEARAKETAYVCKNKYHIEI